MKDGWEGIYLRATPGSGTHCYFSHSLITRPLTTIRDVGQCNLDGYPGKEENRCGKESQCLAQSVWRNVEN